MMQPYGRPKPYHRWHFIAALGVPGRVRCASLVNAMSHRPVPAVAADAAKKIYTHKTNSYGRWDNPYSIYHAIATNIVENQAKLSTELAERRLGEPDGSGLRVFLSGFNNSTLFTRVFLDYWYVSRCQTPPPDHPWALTSPTYSSVLVRFRRLRRLTEAETLAAQDDKVLLPLLDLEHGNAGIFFWRLLQRDDLIRLGTIQGAVAATTGRKQVYINYMRRAGARMVESVLNLLRLAQPTSRQLFRAAREAHVEVFNGYFDDASSFPVTDAMTQHLCGIFEQFAT